MEIKKLIKTYKVYMQCPSCKEGIMIYIDPENYLKTLLYYNEQYKGFPHKCNKCNYMAYYNCLYPYEEKEEIDG